ncbi:MAG: hypothetical protein GXO30_04835 [Epsilonproteobacteria bacterium]|nr:hypothetical protein [Campylobacterota bacterium]
MPLYQVKYKVNSRTYNSDIEAKDLDSVKALFKKLSVAQILEIKEYLYFDTPVKFDVDDYNRTAKLSLYFSNDVPRFIKIPRIKKNILFDRLESYLSGLFKNLEYLKVDYSHF